MCLLIFLIVLESVPPSTWASDLARMVNNSQYSDISFKLQDDSVVFAHRMMLSSRTDYFKTIFEGLLKIFL